MKQQLSLWIGIGLFLLMSFLPAPLGLSVAGWRTAAVAVLMASWWVGEALPIYATALLPLVLFPPMGIAQIKDAAAPFAAPLVFLFMGGFILALALERCQLHRRIALMILARIGTSPRRAVLGFMVCAATLSMWINNTATAMMMMPIGMSVIEVTGQGMEDKARKHFGVALMLSLAYASSIGGIGTLIGTAPNALLAGFLDEKFGFRLGFATWMALAVPLVCLLLPLMYLLLTRWVLKVPLMASSARAQAQTEQMIEGQLAALGPMRPAEVRTACVFGLVAAAWVFQPLLTFIPGLSDPGVAMTGALALFIIPDGVAGSRERLMHWDGLKNLPWGLLLLFGGGLSLARAIEQTKLADWIGVGLSGLSALPTPLLLLLVIVLIVFLTEVTSNTATTASFLPVVTSLALALGENPLLFAVPTAIGASCAFMLPVATPPNAIVYSCPLVEMRDMVRAGLWLNLICIVVLTLASYSLTAWVLDITPGALPSWAVKP
jgi:solute carrier family 13 (sodium-dependent dicarboxylate transporter), member 2/3/5